VGYAGKQELFDQHDVQFAYEKKDEKITGKIS
jgi:hypothetical protein